MFKFALVVCHIVFFSAILSFHAYGNSKFSKDQIVFPVGKSEINKFLALLDEGDNRKVVGIEKGDVSFKDIPTEGSAVFTIGRNSYMLYWADFNNDGAKEYTVIYLFSGSGNYSGVSGSFSLDGRNLTSLNFDKTVVSNLFPGKDMSRFHLYLAKTFAVRVKNRTYLRFIDRPTGNEVFTYEWSGKTFRKAKI